MSLFTIAPHTPFLPCLVDAVMDGRLLGGWPQSGPFWLSDVTIVVPTRRAKDTLAEAFAAHPKAIGLLPDLRTFGGEEPDEEPFLPPFDAPALPSTASSLRRRLVLSRLVAGWATSDAGKQAFATPPTAAEIFSMSESLGRLIDDMTIEERTPEHLRAIGADMGPELGAYWQQTLTFLDIALTTWPLLLATEELSDPASLRGVRLERQRVAAPFLFGDRPVIAAGSTGSIPATARLLNAIHELPRGAVVLPGFDQALTPGASAALRDVDTNPHGHPQYGLVHLLDVFRAKPDDVVELCAESHPRTPLVNLALAPTPETALWSERRPHPAVIAEALAGVSIIRARNEDEEARAIAIAARNALEHKQTVGIVTPDRNLARRIAAELKRFDIRVDDAAGAPLFQSPAGRLVRQILNFVAGGCAPVDLLALLRNGAARFGRTRAALDTLADDIDLGLLRGQRPDPGIAGLRAMLAAHLDGTLKYPARKLTPERGAEIAALFDWTATALAPIMALVERPSISGGDLAVALGAAAEAVSQGAELPGREELAKWAAELAGLVGEGHRFVPYGLEEVVAALMTGFDVRNREERRQDIAIWGQLEARLMSPDVMILGALNEDSWPGTADPGPWLSRGMRLAAGLEPPERQQGLAAHDFVQAIGNATVIVAYASTLR